MATAASGRSAAASCRTLRESLYEYGRGVAGGLIFSLPVLYTQEVWQLGASFGPGRLAAGLAGALLLLVAYNRYAGLRAEAGLAEALIDSVEELGLGLLIAALVLWLVGALRPEQGLAAGLRVLLVEGLAVAIGVSVGTAQLGGGDQGDDGAQSRSGPLSMLALGVCGAVIVAANIAPTEEILQIAGAMGPPRLLLMLALSLALTTVVGFYSDFRGAARGDGPPAAALVLRDTALSYAAALLAAAALLWFFGRLEGVPPAVALARVVVLGMPAALGASAGRLLLGGGR